MSEIDHMSTTSQAESPTYILSSHTLSPEPLPIPEPIINLISPCSALNQLQRGEDINSVTLHGICKSLVITIRTREDHHNQEKEQLLEQIKQLEGHLKEHKETIQQCPEGYEENMQYPRLKINISMGLHHPVKWIKLLDKGTIAGFCNDNGLGSSPHILKIYAQPYPTPEPVEPLPSWFKTILLGPSPMYYNFVQAAGELDDWGIKADIQWFCDMDALLQEANNEVQKWEACATAIAHACQLCKSYLEAVHAPYQLGAFKNLGPVRTCTQLAHQGRCFSPTLVHGHNNVGGE